MKYSLHTTLLALTAMTLMVMTVGSSGLRGLQSVDIGKFTASVPSVKIAGVSQLLQIVNSASEFTNSAFDVITLDSFSQKVTDQGVVYEGKVTVANDQGVTVTGLIDGVWDPVENKIAFSASKYEVDTEDSDNGEAPDASDNSDEGNDNTTDDGYTILDIEAAKSDSNIVAAFEFSHKALIEKGERQNKIPNSDYAVTEWSKASYKVQSNGIYYRFVAKLLGANNVKVDARMTTFKYNNQKLFLAGYYYHAYNIKKGMLPNNFTDAVNSTQPVDNSTIPDNSPQPVDNSTQPIDNPTIPDNSAQPVDNSSQPVDNSTVPDNTQPIDNSTQPVDNSPIPDNSTQPIDNSTQPVDNSPIPENSTQPIDNNTTTNPTEPANNTTPQLTPDNYTIYTADQLAQDSVAQAALQFGANALIQKAISQNKIPAANPNYAITNIVLAGYKKGNIGTSYRFVVNMTNADFVHVDTSLTVFYRYSNKTLSLNGYAFRSYNISSGAGNNNNTAPGNNTQPANNTTPQLTPDNYTIYSAGQLAQDSVAKAALQYGANALIQKAISQNKIPAANPNYTISNVVLAAYKKGNIGTSYKFVVNMINADYVHVDANLTVFYRDSNKTLSLNGYGFKSSNFSSKALANNSGTVVPPATASPSNSTVVEQNNGNTNATVIDSGAVAPVDNSPVVVVDPVVSAPVAGDNSTVVENGNANAGPVVDNTN